ncbi:hypothetical protein [Methylobacterium sp. Gmos1]
MKPGACASGPASCTIGDATQPMDDSMIPRGDSASKIENVNSKSLLEQENPEKHQEHSGDTRNREEPAVSGHASAVHDTVATPDSWDDTGNQAGEKKGSAHRRSIRDWEPLVAFSQILIAVCTFGTLAITGLQLFSMQGQLQEMKEQNKNAMTALDISKKQFNENEKANKIAEDSLNSSERPWLSIKSSLFSEAYNNNSTQVPTTIKNEGRTPAIDVKYKFYYITSNLYSAPDQINESKSEYKSYGIIFPGSQIDITINIPNDFNETISSQKSSNFNYARKSGNISAILMVSYKDTRGKDHLSSICYTFLQQMGSSKLCGEKQLNAAN